MTEAEIRQRKIALSKSGGICEVCCKPLGAHAQAAHRIGNTKANRAKYGDFIIDHPENIGYTCSLECNGALDISHNPYLCIRLCYGIYAHEATKYYMANAVKNQQAMYKRELANRKQREATAKQTEASGKQNKADGSKTQP